MGLDKPNYTQVANLILDDLMRYMSGAELKITLAIARQTFGYHRERYPLTISDLEVLTGLSRPAVVEGVSDGERRGMIKREMVDGRMTYSLVINGEVLAVGKESLPVKKVNHDDGKESLPSAVKKVNRRSKETLPPSVRKVNQNTPALKKGKESSKERLVGGDPTNQPSSVKAPINSPALHALACTLLIKVGLGGSTAKRLADLRPFEDIRRQVAAWLPDRDSGKADTGALIWRVESGEWTAPDLSYEFLRSDLYRQFRTPEERAADEAAEAETQARIAELDAEPEPSVPPFKAKKRVEFHFDERSQIPPDENWPLVLMELRQTGQADISDLEDSYLYPLIGIGDDATYSLVLRPDANDRYVAERLATLIKRTLGSIVKKRRIELIVTKAKDPTP